MAVTVSRVTGDGAEIEVIESNGQVIIGSIPIEFFEDTLGDKSTKDDWIAWVAENSNDVKKALRAKRDGSYINSRYKSFQFRETK